MERLKEIAVFSGPYQCTHLHSSMERLKAEQIQGKKGDLEQFTFQYGEIKSFFCEFSCNSQLKFTFQYGEIKRVDCRKNGLL